MKLTIVVVQIEGILSVNQVKDKPKLKGFKNPLVPKLRHVTK